MNITDRNIDDGKAFDWGRTSEDYAKFRDIYPEEFYKTLLDRNVGVKGQNILDIGTGTGVIPRNMYKYGAKWTGTDISKEQIEQAEKLSEQADMDIKYFVTATEDINFTDNTYDVITACQCFWYFKHEQIVDNFARMLKAGGRMVVLYMAWLPYEDKIAGASEELVLKYSPKWSGAGETIHQIEIPECYKDKFELIYHKEYPVNVHFTRESWNGRMKACRGIGASLSDEEIKQWEIEHKKLLMETTPEEFDVLHYAAIAELKLR